MISQYTDQDYELKVQKLLASHNRRHCRNLVINAINTALWYAVFINVLFALIFLVSSDANIILPSLASLAIILSVIIWHLKTTKKLSYADILTTLDGHTNNHNLLLNGYLLAVEGKMSLFAQTAINNGYLFLSDNIQHNILPSKQQLSWTRAAILLLSLILPSLAGSFSSIASDNYSNHRSPTQSMALPAKSGSNFYSQKHSIALCDQVEHLGSSTSDLINCKPEKIDQYIAGSDSNGNAGSGTLATVINKLGSSYHDKLPDEALPDSIDNNKSIAKMSLKDGSTSQGSGKSTSFMPNIYNLHGPETHSDTSAHNRLFSDKYISGAVSSDSFSTSKANRPADDHIASGTLNSSLLPYMTDRPRELIRQLSSLTDIDGVASGLGDLGTSKESQSRASIFVSRIIPVFIKGLKMNGNSSIFYQSSFSDKVSIPGSESNDEMNYSSFNHIDSYNMPDIFIDEYNDYLTKLRNCND